MLEVKIFWLYLKLLIYHNINQTMILIMAIQLPNVSLVTEYAITCKHNFWSCMKIQLCLSGYRRYIMHRIIATSGRSCEGHHSYTDPSVCILKTLPFQSSTLGTPQLQLTDSSEENKGNLLHGSSCSSTLVFSICCDIYPKLTYICWIISVTWPALIPAMV